MNVGTYGMPAGHGYADWSVWKTEEQAYATGVLKFRNPLGRLPSALTVVLKNLVTNIGYSPGDEVHVLIQNAGPSTTGMSVGVSDREITLCIGGTGWLPSTKTNPTTIPNLAAANWAVRVHLVAPRSAGVLGLPWASRGLLRPFTTEARPIGNVASLYQAFHNPLGRRAILVRPMARCVVGNNGFVPGDIIALGQVSFNSSDPIVVTVGNDTRMEVSASGPIPIVPSAGGTPVLMVANQWQLFVQGLA